MVKWITISLTALGMIMGGIFLMEDQYFNTSEAIVLGERIEKDSVQTFQQQQDYVDLQILDILKDELKEIERRIELSPASVYLKNQYDKLKAKIERIEDRLYN